MHRHSSHNNFFKPAPCRSVSRVPELRWRTSATPLRGGLSQALRLMGRHWSFIVTDKRYLYPIAAGILVAGILAAFAFKDASFFSRAGNFIIGTGVWMGFRYTLREGINRHKKSDSLVIPGTNQLNADHFNSITFSIGDAHLQLHGFALVIIGSFVGSFGDLALKAVFPAYV